jgi:hypothetical protein
MRKLWWIVFGFMALAGLGNLIGGIDTPATARVQPASAPTSVPVIVPATPQFDAVMYVAADTLNLRDGPSTSANVLAKLSRNLQVRAGARQNGWVQVSVQGNIGWVSGDYLYSSVQAAPVPLYTAPAPRSQPRPQPAQSAQSCPSRRYCTQISSCQEARFYLANCSWGHYLDGDNDGVPCEKLCR